MVEADLERAEERAETGETLLANWSCWKRIWNVPKSARSKANRKSWSLKKSCASSATTSSPWKCLKKRPTNARKLTRSRSRRSRPG
ncbi:Uncharacterized protein APZ42_018594 [Daphnia magna]|uniref:Uncharacterized protein n=1 Tax=Daphnia magna TaxID=35525 RepID=A0A162CH38_9CRUS|nr:Uncharacterized protein APZ42_018594 [Daphnia magna]